MRNEQLSCKCDRCKLTVIVTEQAEGRPYFEMPKGWIEWDDRGGTVKLLCPKCDAAFRVWLGLGPQTRKAQR